MPKSISTDRLRFLSGSALKLIAIISMLIDHTAYVLAPVLPFMVAPLFPLMGKQITIYYLMRRIGRLAFPIYCFLIGEGYAHTRDRVRYALRLLIFAVVSELPYNLMLSKALFAPDHQNVFFTLFLGVALIHIYKNVKTSLPKLLAMLAVLVVSTQLDADYGAAGVALILLLYIFRNQRAVQAVLAYPMLSGGVAAFCAFIPINLYNGKRGFIGSGVSKYFFYLFYPLHMLLLVGIRYLLTTY